MSKLEEARKIYEKVNGDEAKFLEATGGMLTPLGAKTYYDTIKMEASASKRFDLITLPADITPAFKERVFDLFKAYYCVYNPQWEDREDYKSNKLVVLTSQNLGGLGEATRSSLSAMSDGLKAGYEEGIKAPRPKPLTKNQRMDQLYDVVRGHYPLYIKTATEELKIPMEQADLYWDKAVAKRNKTKPA